MSSVARALQYCWGVLVIQKHHSVLRADTALVCGHIVALTSHMQSLISEVATVILTNKFRGSNEQDYLHTATERKNALLQIRQ